jgi:hypothetical protein
MRLSIIALAFILASCSREPDSPIVQRVEQAGAGKVRNVSDSALLDWFQKHQDVGQPVRKLCQPLLKNAPAGWADTTEGRVCRSAQAAAAFYFEGVQGDGVGFVPGK